LSVEDYVGGYRKALPYDETLFNAAKLKVFEKVERLKDIIPSLLVVREDLLDGALSSNLLWFVMNRQITKPFSVCLSVTDVQLHITAMIVFRHIGFGYTVDSGSGVFPFLDPKQVMWFIFMHHFIRKICEAAALAKISKKVAMKYMFELW
jgi:hypothetical protein